MAGTSGSFGGAGRVVTAGGVLFAAAGVSLTAWAIGSRAEDAAGSSDLTSALVIFEDLSFFPAAAATNVLAVALAAAGELSAAEATAGSVLGCLLELDFVESGAFFAAACASLPEPVAGATGMMEAILSFSTSTYPKSVLTLNMLSCMATNTP